MIRVQKSRNHDPYDPYDPPVPWVDPTPAGPRRLGATDYASRTGDDPMSDLTDSTKQPAPAANNRPPLWPLVQDDVALRDIAGKRVFPLLLKDMAERSAA
jgi:hypothetical protein